jgi:hypothetical protein
MTRFRRGTTIKAVKPGTGVSTGALILGELVARPAGVTT